MTFIEALKTGRPIRRPADYEKPWLFLGWDGGESMTFALISSTVLTGGPRWRNIHNGAPAGLSKEDYLADDWEAMP